MKTQKPFLIIVLVLTSFIIQGCVGLLFDAAMESVGIAKWRPITLNKTPFLTENSPLGSIPPLSICIMKFKDDRGVGRENKVGASITQTPGLGMGSEPIIADNIESVSSLLTEAISSEIKRNNHNVVTDQEYCDFVFSGVVKEFWISFPGFFTKKCEGKITADIEIQRKKDNKVFFVKTYNSSYATSEYKGDAPPYLMAEALDGALVVLLKNITQDPDLLIKLKEQFQSER